MGEPTNDTGALNSPDRIIKFIKDLSAAVILQLIAVGLVYLLVAEIRPALGGVAALTTRLAAHETAQAEFYQRHLYLMEENIRLARLQCVTYQESLKRPTALCQGVAK